MGNYFGTLVVLVATAAVVSFVVWLALALLLQVHGYTQSLP